MNILPKTKEIKLKNGLKVLMVQSHKSPVVSIQMWVRTGSADEKKGEEGISHFIEHLVFKGTRKFKVGEIASVIEGSGGELNAYTSFDQTVFYVTISKHFSDIGLTAIAEMMGFPKFDPVEINNEREVVIEEIKRGQDSLGRRSSQLLFSTTFKKHPYGVPVIGFDKNIRKVSAKKLVDYYHSRYTPQNMFLVVAGDFESTEMKNKIMHNFGEFKAYKVKKIKRAKEPIQSKPRFAIEKAAFEQSVCYLSWKVPGLKHKDIPALDVLSMILGHGDTSRLVQKMRIEKPLVSSVGAGVFAPEEQGLFTISMGYQKENLQPALSEINGVMEELFRGQFAAAEIERAILSLETDKFYAVETVDGIARTVGSQEFSAKDQKFNEKYLNLVRKVRGADLLKVAKKYLVPEKITVAIVTNDEAKEAKEMAMAWQKAYSQIYKKAKAIKHKEPKIKIKKIQSQIRESKMAIERLNLSSGVKVLFYPSQETHLVSAKAAFLGGLRNESDAQGGLTELLTRTWLCGTKTRSEQQIYQELEACAASLGPVAGRNSIGLGLDVLSAFEEEGAALFLDVLTDPIFLAEAIDREKVVQLHEIRSKADSPSSVAGREFMEHLFSGHPYSRDLLGSETSVSGLQAKDVQRHWAQISQRKNLTIVVSGNCNKEKWKKWIEKATANLGPSEVNIKKFSIVKTAETQHTFKESKKEQSHVIYGFLGLTVTDQERYALEIIQSILAGQGGRLFLELRDKNSLAYSVSPMKMEGVDTGYFGAYIGCSPEKVQKAVSMMKEQFELLMTTPVGDDELKRAQRYLVGKHDIHLQRTSAAASSILYDEIYGNNPEQGLKVAEKYFSITSREVMALAKKIFSQNPVISVVGPTNPWK